jgi:hypothetical protein
MLFDISKSSVNISLLQNLKPKYILVLDADNKITNLKLLISIAEKNKNFSIFQPEIHLNGEQTFYQYIFSTLGNIITTSKEIFHEQIDHCSFYGKGLINVEDYVNKVINTDAIPVNCMSHDTFEAMILPCKYVKEVSITETYPSNHCSWSVRETRWNVGDLQVFSHHTPFHFFRKEKFHFSFKKTFISLASFRIIIFRPLSFLFIILHCFVKFREVVYINLLWSFILSSILTSVILVVKNKNKKKYSTQRLLMCIISSILFYVPETISGTVRFVSSVKNSLVNVKWIPSSLVEMRTKEQGYIRSSFNEFWLSMILGSVITYEMGFDNPFLLIISVSCILLPFLSAVTSFHYCVPNVVFNYPNLET